MNEEALPVVVSHSAVFDSGLMALMVERDSPRRPRHLIPGLWSIGLPIAVGLVTFVALSVYHSDFWQKVEADPGDDSDRIAGALMAFSEIILLCAGIFFSSLIGSILGLVSVLRQEKLFGVGLLGLAMNLTIVITLVVFVFRL